MIDITLTINEDAAKNFALLNGWIEKLQIEEDDENGNPIIADNAETYQQFATERLYDRIQNDSDELISRTAASNALVDAPSVKSE